MVVGSSYCISSVASLRNTEPGTIAFDSDRERFGLRASVLPFATRVLRSSCYVCSGCACLGSSSPFLFGRAFLDCQLAVLVRTSQVLDRQLASLVRSSQVLDCQFPVLVSILQVWDCQLPVLVRISQILACQLAVLIRIKQVGDCQLAVPGGISDV